MLDARPAADVTAIIPAAGLGTRLMPISSSIPKAMVPVGGQPLISRAINHLARQGVHRIVIVIGRHGDQLRGYVEHVYRQSSLEISFAEQATLDGPLGALRVAQPQAGDGPQLVYLGDTLTRDPLRFDRDFVLAYPVEDHWRWCLALPDERGNLVRLIDKPARLEACPTDLALIGVYYFADGSLLRDAIEETYAAGETLHGEYQLSSAIERYRRLRPIEVRPADEWFDCGSIDRYIETRRRLIESRNFNTIHVDDLGVLHKESASAEDLGNEIGWYLSVPAAVHPLVPRVFGHSITPERVSLSLEYFPVPALSELYLYASVHPEVWEYALGRILDLWWRTFHATRGRDEAQAAKTLAMYWAKTERRLAQSAQQTELPEGEVRLNGRLLPAWPDLRGRLRAAVEEVAARPHWSLVHGDFHFGNILFDFNSGQVKLVDPRGSFGGPGCYGDARYDLAKLLHSFHGGYAHLAGGMFELRRTGGDAFELCYFGGADREHLLGCFKAWLAQHEVSFAEIELIEGLLFLSLLPLHAEDRERQLAAYLIGRQLVAEALEVLET